MADAGRGSLRLGAALALSVVALFELLALAHGVRAQRRLRASAAREAARRVDAVRGELDRLLARGRDGWDAAAQRAIELGLASEVEVIDADDKTVFSRPHLAPVASRLREPERRELAAGRIVSAVARDGAELRVLVYLPLPGSPGELRLAAPAPELEDDAREWQTVLLGHAAALSALALALVLVLWPGPASSAPAPHEGALSAYEEAMGRLRAQGQELSDRYREDTQRMQARLRELEAMARAGELTAGIVHEVRNGLGTIVGYAKLLERARGAAPEPKAILEECATLETVVRRFNDFIRIERLQLADTDLAPLAARVVAREGRGHPTVEARLRGLDAPLVVRADEELLERALENVVRNALQAAAAGGGHLELRAERKAGAVRLEVEDDGPGFAPDHPGEVKPFYTTRPGGLGLGLPLARKIVLLHGGELTLERGTPSGARVCMTLPSDGFPA